MLRDNAYVAIVSLDFSRAFDTVRHSTLVEKLSALELQDHIFNWIVNFLSGRQHVTRFKGQTSKPAYINASVVQGSGLGPSTYDISASDLHPVNTSNKMLKYADDTYLLVGSRARNTISEELNNVTRWAALNNLKLNSTKSREMIVTRRGWVDLPPPMEGLLRVESLRILGVTLGSDLTVTRHVEEIVGACSGSLHALRVLRGHGLPSEALHVVAEATTVSRLLYAAPSWWGLASAAERGRLQRVLDRATRQGYVHPEAPTIEQRVSVAEDRLLKSIMRNETHVLGRFFPPRAQHYHALRPRKHEYELPTKDNKNYINRVLYKNILKPLC